MISRWVFVLLLLIGCQLGPIHSERAEASQLARLRTKRWAGCFSIIGCMGSAIQIMPLRFNIDLFRIYDRLKGVNGYSETEWLELTALRMEKEFLQESIRMRQEQSFQRTQLLWQRLKLLEDQRELLQRN